MLRTQNKMERLTDENDENSETWSDYLKSTRLHHEYFQYLPFIMLLPAPCSNVRIAAERRGPVTAACSDTWVASICHCVLHHAGEQGRETLHTVCF